MALTHQECLDALDKLSPREELRFLARFGHRITVVARGTYEFQAPGVVDPRSLRNYNEIHHRIYAQIRSLVEDGTRNIDSESLASWLTGEGRDESFRDSCLWAFEQALLP